MRDLPGAGATGRAREVFGSPSQQALLTRSEDLMHLLGEDPRFCSHGRGVACADYDADLAEAVARVIGLCPCDRVPKSESPALQEEFRRRGLQVDVYTRFEATDAAAARACLASHPLPDDLRVDVIDAASDPALLAAYAEVAQPNGVLQSNGGSLRGQLRPGFGLVAFDPANRPVAVAAAVMSGGAVHARPGSTQWGQIATVADRQGEGLARALGALSIVRAFDDLGASLVYTGIRDGNAPSVGLCTGLGVTATAYDMVVAIDPSMFAGGRLTK